MDLVEIENVVKLYEPPDGGSPVRVLHGVCERVGDGEFVSLMGRSGSGKSTLLTILGAMNRPTEGRLLVDGIDVYGLAEEARADFRREYIGFVFQQHHLLPYMTVVENVMLPLATIAVASRAKREKALAVLDRVGLADKARRLPNQLSGGEQGRVAIARALVNEAPLLLADEPTGALDTTTGRQVLDVFLELNAQGQTIFMVTHNPENAALAHRTLRIQDGYILSPLEPAESAIGSQGKCVANERSPFPVTDRLDAPSERLRSVS